MSETNELGLLAVREEEKDNERVLICDLVCSCSRSHSRRNGGVASK